ncbi:MAG: NAD-dependent epimerase/dehydratase family protein [Pseudomonadota bacterium]
MKTALVTGASGFVGRALCESLVKQGVQVHAVVRDARRAPDQTQPFCINDIREFVEWEDRLADVEVVFHLAGLAHQVRLGKLDQHSQQLDIMCAFNVVPTRRLAQAAEKAGVKRFVYVSSIKVNGEQTQNQAFCEQDTPCPEDAYGQSKWMAEQALESVDVETVIIRPPLVYGEGVKGNFLSLLKLCDTFVPLPFSCIRNQRSLIYLQNLVDALCLCAHHPNAANKVFLVKDGMDTMTVDLVKGMRQCLGRFTGLFPLPATVLKTVFRLMGRSIVWEKFSGSLQVNDDQIRGLLGWTPPFSLTQGLQNTVRWYQNAQEK